MGTEAKDKPDVRTRLDLLADTVCWAIIFLTLAYFGWHLVRWVWR